MELTAKQEADIQKIMVEMDCPYDFLCYESKFEKLSPVRVYRGANVIRCQYEGRLNCRFGRVFGVGILFCQCPLRNYVAFELSR